MKKILLTLLTASMLITGCTSVTKSGVVGADRKQFMLVSSEAMEQSSAQAYVKTLTAARSKGELNVDPILTKRVQDIAKRLIAQTGVFRDDALKWKWQVNVINEDTSKRAPTSSKTSASSQSQPPQDLATLAQAL